MSFSNSIKSGFYTVKNAISDNKCEIELVSGNILILAGVFFAFKAGSHIEKRLEDRKTNVKAFKEIYDNYEPEDENDIYDEKMLAADIRKTNIECIKSVSKKAAIPVIGVVGGIVLVDKAFVDMKTMFKQASFAAVSIAAAFANYRGNVVKELGENMDEHFMYGISADETKVKLVTTDEDGNEVVTEEEMRTADNLLGVSEFAVWWTPDTTNRYQSDPYYFEDFIKNTEHYYNDTLVCCKKITVNEIKNYLGFKEKYISMNGQAYGWKGGDTIKIKVIKAARPIGDGKYEPTYLVDFNAHYILSDYPDTVFTDKEFGDDGWVEMDVV